MLCVCVCVCVCVWRPTARLTRRACRLQKKSEARFFNIFMWMMLSVGMGLLLVLYSREWYARFGDHNYQFNDVTFAAPGSFSHFVVPQSLPSSFYASPLLKWLLP